MTKDMWLTLALFAVTQIVVLIIYVVSTRASQQELGRRMDKSDKHHAEHFQHATTRALHGTPEDRSQITERMSKELDAHSKLDDMRFSHVTEAVSKLDIKLDKILDKLGAQ